MKKTLMVFVGESEACNQIRSMYNGLFDSTTKSRAVCIVIRLYVGCPYSSAVHIDHKNISVQVQCHTLWYHTFILGTAPS